MTAKNLPAFLANTHRFFSAPLIQLVTNIGSLVVIFMLLYRWILVASALPQSSYTQPFLASELVKHLFSDPFKILLSSLLVGIIIVRFPRFWISWPKVELGQYIRPFIVLLAFLLCWWYATYDYNLFFNQAHYYDRFLLISLFFLIIWRPLFVLPFLLLATAIIWQFFYPLPSSYSWAQPSMPLSLLTMFIAVLFFYALTGKQKIIDWLFLGLCLIAAHYWISGFAKMKLDWISYGHIHNLLAATYANGWLAFLDPLQISAIARTAAEFDWLIRITTLVLQLGAVFLLWRRFSLLGFLICWTIFHAGIFAMSGILFWQWIIIELAALLLIKILWKNQPIPFLNKQYFILSIFLISTSIFWVRAVGLAWYDTPISYTFRFEATGESGQRYSLPPSFFTPYEYPFTLGYFSYLAQEPRLSVTWGSANQREVADKLLEATTKETIHQIERDYGHDPYDKTKSEVFDNFMRQFIYNFNKRGSKITIFEAIQAPRQLWTFPRGTVYDNQEKIVQVYVYQVTSWFDGELYHEIKNQNIRRIAIKL